MPASISKTSADQCVTLLEQHSACVQEALKPLFSETSHSSLEKRLQEVFEDTKQRIDLLAKAEFSEFSEDASIPKKQAFVQKARQRLNQKVFTHWFKCFNEQLGTDLTTAQKVTIYKVLSSKAFEKTYQQSLLPPYTILKDNNRPSTKLSADLILYGRQPEEKKTALTSHRYGQLTSVAPNAEMFKSIHSDFDRAMGESSEPMVYQSLMPIRGRLAKNSNQSLSQVFEAAHVYNASVVNTGKFLWIQNISPDGSGENLGGFFSSSLNKEATLMADMALLYTLQSTLNIPLLKKKYAAVVEQYKAFLNNGGRQNFYASTQGQVAADSIKELKRSLEFESFRSQFHEYKEDPDTGGLTINDDLNFMLKKSLLKIFTFNYHYQQSNASMVHALSGFVGKKTLIGVDTGTGFEEVQTRIDLLVNYEMQENKPREEVKAENKHWLEEKSLPSLKIALRRFLISRPLPPEELSKQLILQPDNFEKYDDKKAVSHSQQSLFKTGLKLAQKAAKDQLAFLSPPAFVNSLAQVTLLCSGGLSLGLYAAFAIYALTSLAFPPLLMSLMLVSTVFAGASLIGLGIDKLVDYCRASDKGKSGALIELAADASPGLAALGSGPGEDVELGGVNPSGSELFADAPPSDKESLRLSQDSQLPG